MSDGDICFSSDEEVYNADSVHELMGDFEEGEEVMIYKAEAVGKTASDFLYFDSSSLSEQAIDSMGEYADSWLTGITKEQDADLQLMLEHAVDAWADKNKLQPTFYGIRNKETLMVKVLAEGAYEILEGEE